MFQIKKEYIESISYYSMTPACDLKGDIILYHGWGSEIERQCFRAQILASEGYRVLIPELYVHGCRGQCEYRVLESITFFFTTILQSIEEFELFLKKTIVDTLPCLIIGHSLGGMIALGCASKYIENISGVVSMNSTANWEIDTAFLKGVFPGYSLNRYQRALDKNCDLIAQLQKYRPEKWCENTNHVPVFLTNGALDTIIPSFFNDDFCRQHEFSFVKHTVYEECGHIVSDRMLYEVLEFIKKECS